VVTDAREWRRLKTLFEVFSETEENMFSHGTAMADQSGLQYPQLFMRAKEALHIPFKLQTFLSKVSPSELKTASSPFAQEQTYANVERDHQQRFKPKEIRVRTNRSHDAWNVRRLS
jgi:hypothetical protein